MNIISKRQILPSLIAAGLIGASLIPAKPASADDRRLLKDAGLGAAAGVVSGAVLKNGSPVNNAINGAAAGAAVNLTNRNRKPNLARDAAVGAAASTASGLVTKRGRNSLKNAIGGAAAGALINIDRRR